MIDFERQPWLKAEAWPADKFANRPQLRRLDVQAVLAMRPCWLDGPHGEDRVREMAVGLPEQATLLEVLLRLRSRVGSSDLLWLATRPGWYVHPGCALRWLAADFAASALPTYEADYPDDPRPRRAIEAARQRALDMIDGADWSAAESAARSALRSAAGSAAWSAAVDRVIALLSGAVS